jgi:hypothetical protein
VVSLQAEYVPTKRNGPCLKFFEGSNAVQQANLFTWGLKDEFRPPQHIAIDRDVDTAFKEGIALS